jgi:hypothetical protein
MRAGERCFARPSNSVRRRATENCCSDFFGINPHGLKILLTGCKCPCYKAIRSLGQRSSGVEQLIRNQQVAGSNPTAGSIFLLLDCACIGCLKVLPT